MSGTRSGATSPRNGRRVALVAHYPQPDPAMPQLISNHGLRMVEASLRAAAMPDLELLVLDLHNAPLDQLAHTLLRFDPDVVGFSTYLWSFPLFLNVASILKHADPSRVIVLGGPSARPSMLKLSPFHLQRDAVDILVLGEGERAFVEIVASRDRSNEHLQLIPGLALRDEEGWLETPARPLDDLNLLASPYSMGLVPLGGLGVLQTYRGCPFTCSFCEWGTMESPKRVRHPENLHAELAGMSQAQVHGAILVDAGLNLNQWAFSHLERVAKESEFFVDRQFICEVYPARVTESHIRFLEGIGQPLIGMGIQSFDNEVLANVERNYDEAKFQETLERLTSVASVALEIILGLPGDNPENFAKTFARARSLPCALRVYHCVVLPSALMVRAPAHYDLDYDAQSLKMRSCWGWSREALETTCQQLNDWADRGLAQRGEYFWVFPPP